MNVNEYNNRGSAAVLPWLNKFGFWVQVGFSSERVSAEGGTYCRSTVHCRGYQRLSPAGKEGCRSRRRYCSVECCRLYCVGNCGEKDVLRTQVGDDSRFSAEDDFHTGCVTCCVPVSVHGRCVVMASGCARRVPSVLGVARTQVAG